MPLATLSIGSSSMGGVGGWYPRVLVQGDPADLIASGFRVGMGNGTATPLFISTSGVGIISSGNSPSVLISHATAPRNVHLADGEGYLFPGKRVVLPSDVTSVSTSQAAVSGFTVSLEASSLYSFEMILLATSAATTTGVKLAVTGPSEIDWTSYTVSHISANAIGTGATRTMQASAWGTEFAAADAPAANTVFPILVKGFFKTSASAPSSPIGLTIATEVGASTVTLKAGSEILVTKRN